MLPLLPYKYEFPLLATPSRIAPPSIQRRIFWKLNLQNIYILHVSQKGCDFSVTLADEGHTKVTFFLSKAVSYKVRFRQKILIRSDPNQMRKAEFVIT